MFNTDGYHARTLIAISDCRSVVWIDRKRIPLIMFVYAAPLFCEVIIYREQGQIMPSTVVSPLI
jgi:hypothetical protein